jgi:pectate lyase
VGCGGSMAGDLDGENPEHAVEEATVGLVGWAAVAGSGVNGGTVGGSGTPVLVTTVSQFNSMAGGTSSRVIQVSGTLKGTMTVGSNKTIIGLSGATIHGHLELKGSVNVILRNLKVVGQNCTDDSDCQSGTDAITIESKSHHIWVDHCDISDGSDGNLDITHGSDFITVSWTKFSYSGKRAGGHQFSNLIGHSDSNSSEDSGHLNVTWHHDWWAGNVQERMPRVRFGKVHSFNNLFTSSGNNYCIRAGTSSLILSENNAFVKVDDPFDIDGGNLLTRGDLFSGTTGNKTGTGKGFTPPYAYTLTAASSVQSAVQAGAGPR